MASQTKMDTRIFSRLFKFTKPYRGKLIFAFLCALTLALLSPMRPLLIVYIVNKYVLETPDGTQFGMWLLLVFGMLFLEAVLQFSATYFSNLLAQSVIRDIRVKVFSHITTFRMRYFDKTPVGNLVTRVVSDIEAISEVFSSGLIDIISDLLMLVVIIVVMFVINWQLTALALIPALVLIYATRVFARAMRKSFQQESTQVNRLNTFVQERITGMNIVQLYGREEVEYKAFEEINKDHRQAHINAVWAFSIFFPVVEFLSSFSTAFLILWGAYVFTGPVAPEKNVFLDIFAFSMWISMMYRPIRQLADKFNILQRGVVRAERVFQIIDTEEHVQESGTVDDCDFQQELRFQNVSFAYTDDQPVLKNINLTIEPGKTVAFVGATGAGKTSIVNLLGRFYEYQQGEIYIGEHELRSIKMDYLRKNIAIVLQDIFLFSDTVHNNITLGNPDISREQVIEAARAVGADYFIQLLPGGYDYQVGERGGVLSVGQRQLLAFIRAYVYNPHILILDEATSSVDNESEEMIQEATAKLTEGRTSIVIAHRLSTIQQADTIVVLDKGEIKEMGSHDELLQLDGYYKRLFTMQFARS
ncbi:MAG: antibiotic ABC transporter ATP-binding protein [Candidatus Fluviicola riflensis]|nr:MAG: antibiotic ABC transporter ATP-binding protein [Candidatus Fluviicola riflensis]OGS76740.1 MAG: antibiotic ABC transporter ATP-binding protein [Candidatus Fluviicola riflensis]OGS82905.1 MAG: antibiotic ABC transporter ATP-binding protein [Fluviicola sp. RIFCSPHIGHO2_01_FULL_43_53]OGS88470.1 MAG: antibiotic ABC transporter ATP-binding protein [Fluviicola sp. RIFCSPHIGHO2_12_FULL_43_24]